MEDSFARQRERMLAEQLVARGISDARVLAAMRSVPRHLFVDPASRQQAYQDHPLPIGAGQTISQPYIVASMLQSLQLAGHEKVLEIGTGSGYQTALLAQLTRQVFSLERHEILASKAASLLAELGVANAKVIHADGSLGWPAAAPYEAIIAAAGAPAVPPPLLAQLAPNGRLVIPVGEVGNQRLELWTRKGDSYISRELASVAFVPLVGVHGWKAEAAD